MKRVLDVMGSSGMVAIHACLFAYFFLGSSWAWFLAFCWATSKAMEHMEDAKRWQNAHARAVQTAEENRTGSIFVKGYSPLRSSATTPDVERSGRVNEKLKAQAVSLQKMNTDLQGEIRKRDKIIAELRESQKPKRERAKTNG